MQFDMSTIWQVAGILKSPRKACLYNFDLYVDCTYDQALTIQQSLIERHGYGKIHLTIEGCEKGEYCFKIVT